MKLNNSILRYIINMFFIVLGTYILSVAINVFLLPSKMSTGGFSGIATVLYYMLNIPVGITILILNLPLFIISYFKIGKEFTIKSVIATIMLSIFLEVFDYSFLDKYNNLDSILSCALGGMLTGIGLSFVFRVGASTGGSDLLANILSNIFKNTIISKNLLVIETTIVILMIVFLKDINAGVYSIIALFISSKMIDMFYEGINKTRVVTIITKKKDEIIFEILYNMDKGATIINSIGAHSKEENYTITCIIDRNQITKFKRKIYEIDNKCMMYITIANEAIGEGFKVIS